MLCSLTHHGKTQITLIPSVYIYSKLRFSTCALNPLAPLPISIVFMGRKTYSDRYHPLLRRDLRLMKLMESRN